MAIIADGGGGRTRQQERRWQPTPAQVARSERIKRGGFPRGRAPRQRRQVSYPTGRRKAAFQRAAPWRPQRPTRPPARQAPALPTRSFERPVVQVFVGGGGGGTTTPTQPQPGAATWGQPQMWQPVSPRQLQGRPRAYQQARGIMNRYGGRSGGRQFVTEDMLDWVTDPAVRRWLVELLGGGG